MQSSGIDVVMVSGEAGRWQDYVVVAVSWKLFEDSNNGFYAARRLVFFALLQSHFSDTPQPAQGKLWVVLKVLSSGIVCELQVVLGNRIVTLQTIG